MKSCTHLEKINSVFNFFVSIYDVLVSTIFEASLTHEGDLPRYSWDFLILRLLESFCYFHHNPLPQSGASEHPSSTRDQRHSPRSAHSPPAHLICHSIAQYYNIYYLQSRMIKGCRTNVGNNVTGK